MMNLHTVSAELRFYSADNGGLVTGMTSPTPSLIMLFPPLTEEENEPVQIGAMLEIAGGKVLPGSESDGKLIFWSDLSRIYAAKGSDFLIWYDGRIVGQGIVKEIIEGA